MDKESIYELQKIDCNCNDCGFMQRDNEKFQNSLWFHYNIQMNDFLKEKARLNKLANDFYRIQELEKGYQVEQELSKMKFQFDKSGVRINYGNCSKLNKPVSFIPAYMSTDDTFSCFVHRKDVSL